MSELVFGQDFLSIFKAVRRFPCVVANGYSFHLTRYRYPRLYFLWLMISSISYSSLPSTRSGGGFVKLGPWVSVS